MPECIFCRIAEHDLSAEIVYEDENAVAFLDINPIAPGHTVIIPKRHTANILELEDDGVRGLFVAVRNVMKSVQEAMKPAGFNYGVNQGRVAGQVIDHLHVHLLPRFEDDGGGSMHSIVRNPPKQQTLEEIAGVIRGAGGFKQTERIEAPHIRQTAQQQPPPKQEAPTQKEEEGLGEKLKELEEEIVKHTRVLKRMKRP